MSALVAAIPIMVLFCMMGVWRKPAWMAASSALASAFAVALLVYGMPIKLAVMSAIFGAAFGIFPLTWICFGSILLYRMAVDTGKFEVIKDSVGWLDDGSATAGDVHRLLVRRLHRRRSGIRRAGCGIGRDARRPGVLAVLRGRHLPARQHDAGRVRIAGNSRDDAGQRYRAAGAWL